MADLINTIHIITEAVKKDELNSKSDFYAVLYILFIYLYKSHYECMKHERHTSRCHCCLLHCTVITWVNLNRITKPYVMFRASTWISAWSIKCHGGMDGGMDG